MLIETESVLKIPEDIEEIEYPPEFVEQLDARYEIAKLKIATGELVPQTVEELAAELGINLSEADLNNEDDYD